MSNHRRLWSPKHVRIAGVALIASSYLRWPATVMIASAEPAGAWYFIAALQVTAEVMWWAGLWMVGRDKWRAALAQFAGLRPVRATIAWTMRPFRSA